MGFNKNFFVSLTLLLLMLISINVITGDHAGLPGMFAIFTIFYLLPLAFYLKKSPDYFLGAALAILPLAFWFRTHNPYAIKAPIFALFLIPLFISLLLEKKKRNITLFDIIVLSAMPIIFLLSLFPPMAGEKLAESAIHFAAFFCVYLGMRNTHKPLRIGNVLIFIGAMTSIWGIVQWLGMDPFIPIPQYSKFDPSNRILGTLGNANFLSGYLIGIFAYTFFRFISRPSKILGSALSLILISILLTGTRGVIAAFVLGLLIFAVLMPKNRKSIAIAFVLLLVLVFLIPGTRKRFMMMPGQIINKTGSLGQRGLMWKTAVSMIKDRPFGVGPAGFRLLYPDYQGQHLDDPAYNLLSTHARHPHNQLLEWAAIGSVFLMAWFLFIMLFTFLLFIRVKKKGYLGAALFALMVILLHNMISVVLNYEPALTVFAVLLGMIGGSIGPAKFKFSRKLFIIPALMIIPVFLLGFSKMIGSYYFSRGVGLINFYNTAHDQKILLDAKEELLTSAKWDPAFVNSWYRLGNIYTILARNVKGEGKKEYFEKAVHYLREADMRKPAYYETRYNMGLALINLGRLDEAEAALAGALLIEPNKLNALRQWTELYIGRNRNTASQENRAEILRRLDRFSKAIEITAQGLPQVGIKMRTQLTDEVFRSRLYLQKQKAYHFFIWGDLKKAYDLYCKAYGIDNISDEEKKHIINNILAISKKAGDRESLKKWIAVYRKDLPRSGEAYLEEAIYRTLFEDRDQGISMLKGLLEKASSGDIRHHIYQILLNNSLGDVIHAVGGPADLGKISGLLYTGKSKEQLIGNYPEYEEFINGFREDPWKNIRIIEDN